jgi:hypothetical protein
MKTQDKTTRQLAIEWIRNHDVKEQRNLVDKYFHDRTDYTLLTGREIEQIYLSEHKAEWNKSIQETVDLDDWANDGSEPTTLPKVSVEEAYKHYKENEKLRISEFRLFRAGANWQKQKMDDYLDNDVCKAFGRGFKDAKQQSELKYNTLLESHKKLFNALEKAIGWNSAVIELQNNGKLDANKNAEYLPIFNSELETELNNAKQIKP